ncbi:hypothetical protein SLUN_00890 [Streptomyces lunaelactis]|uniref:Uncharacterized protein n=1 Tax=Streptomyces lunaelactis TaxID=1535768 RepID=A0A2R4SVZ5_9ACTN|nr:hypothetical protein [Streptomyces lunaelactis]AVZ71022.1 hypothetical protein SLUN_00890 [Streptomyces lunaelactis]NUK24032.1 hypothetical protein [Streptomyces lunaelactis]NUK85716.1 hypothetical protein [Streptomyces lunaelactis]
MTIDLLPATGVRLPGPLPELVFGMSEQYARRVLAPHAALSDAFVCGTDWAVGFDLPGCSITLSASDGGGLSIISLSRRPVDERVACPVAFQGVDVFRWSAAEIIEALHEQGETVQEHHSGSVWIGNLHLSPTLGHQMTASTRKKPRTAPPYVFGFVCLYGPGMLSRDRRP